MTCDDVKEEYQRLKYDLGWRVLYSREATLKTARVAFITLNPGGSKFEKNLWSYEEGSAYEKESWLEEESGQSLLQKEVLQLFAALGVKPDEVLSGVLVPFRSPSWKKLPNRRDALAFGEKLWSYFLDTTQVKQLVVMSKLVEKTIVRITKAELDREEKTGWGNLNFRVYKASNQRTIITIPHLSRFRLFSSDLSKQKTQAFLMQYQGSYQ